MRYVLTAVFALAFAGTSDAQIFRHRLLQHHRFQTSSFQSQSCSCTQGVNGVSQSFQETQFSQTFQSESGSSEALNEVNAKRAQRGLRPFIFDPALTQAAIGAANFRAANGLFGHTSNDFAFVPRGGMARSAGCAAYPPSHGWMSCCVEGNYTYAGAAWAMGRDGKRYMHLFVR
jgi:hypothetical protein